MNNFMNSKAGQYAVLGVVGLVGVIVLFKLVKGEAKAAADAVGGVVSGKNSLTAGTPYEGKGVMGTVGAGFNAASGGAFQEWGEGISGWLFDLTHD